MLRTLHLFTIASLSFSLLVACALNPDASNPMATTASASVSSSPASMPSGAPPDLGSNSATPTVTPAPVLASATPDNSIDDLVKNPVNSTSETSEVQALRLEAGNRFLSASGQRVSLRVLDHTGNPIDPSRLSFFSSRPQDFSVDAQGQVQARVSDGFSTITVKLNGSNLTADQLFSVTSPTGGGGGGGARTGLPQENVNGQIEFQF